MERKTKIILLDSDVISHFIANDALADLPLILAPHICVVLDYVYKEIARHSFRKDLLDALISDKRIEMMDFPLDDEAVKREFALIKKRNYLIGDGERACMAVARFSRDVVASSNFRDIAPYCKTNDIDYLGTLDILAIAVKKELYDECKCDLFMTNARDKNKARFPREVTRFCYYVEPDLSFLD
ncbi:MAG: hypothetical protein LLG05_02685 [Porphyromonadaceae bacterium]|jgi:hypothetical protein|nr:hypothetical protein [Porphyromonadaceae bacterium]MDD3359523.1 hypothetical protein [Parabacteroides sp.]MDD4404048.1 hypothetical protein [Parabacteroides sp.]